MWTYLHEVSALLPYWAYEFQTEECIPRISDWPGRQYERKLGMGHYRRSWNPPLRSLEGNTK